MRKRRWRDGTEAERGGKEPKYIIYRLHLEVPGLLTLKVPYLTNFNLFIFQLGTN